MTRIILQMRRPRQMRRGLFLHCPPFPLVRSTDRKSLVRAITVLVLSIVHPSFQPILNLNQIDPRPFPHPSNNHAPTTSQPSFGSNTRTTRFRLNHPASMILQTKPLSNLIPTSTKKTGAKSSVQSPLQAKCRASSTQRSRSRVTFVILPATPRPVPSKKRPMFIHAWTIRCCRIRRGTKYDRSWRVSKCCQRRHSRRRTR